MQFLQRLAEIERRYENVEAEEENIRKRLEEMKEGGKGVLKGQAP